MGISGDMLVRDTDARFTLKTIADRGLIDGFFDDCLDHDDNVVFRHPRCVFTVYRADAPEPGQQRGKETASCHCLLLSFLWSLACSMGAVVKFRRGTVLAYFL